MPIITNAGEYLITQQQQAGQPLIIDKMILANIAGLDSNAIPSRDQVMPAPEDVKILKPITKDGLLNSNVVVYSTVFPSTDGTFDFNYMALYSSAHDVIVAVAYVPLQTKIKTVGTDIGNVITKNFAIEFTAAANITGINISAESWQIDYTARLMSMDKHQRDMARNIYGRSTFLNDGFKVKHDTGKYYLTSGKAILGGINYDLPADVEIEPDTLPQTVWIDAYQETSMMGVLNKYEVVLNDGTAKTDYVLGSVEHTLVRVGVINSSVSIDDVRDVVCSSFSLVHSNTFEGVSDALDFVTDNPFVFTNINTRSYKTRKECEVLGVVFPDGGHASYECGIGLGTADGIKVFNAGAVQMKLVLNKMTTNRMFGTVGDGIADETVRLRASILSGVKIDKGNYIISDLIELNDEIKKINLDAEAVITQTVNLPIIYKGGSLDNNNSSSVSGTLEKGETYVSTSSPHGFVAGDWVYFRCNNLTPNVTAGSRVSCIRRVIGADANSFRVDKAFYRAMSINVTVRKILLGSRVVIEGGVFNSQVSVDNKEALLHFYNCEGPIIRSSKIGDSGGCGVLLQNCVGGRFEDSDIHDLLDGINTNTAGVESNYYGYGIAFAGATRGFSVVSGSIGRVRHAVTTLTMNDTTAFQAIPEIDKSTVLARGEPEDISVSYDVYCYETTEAALDTHEQGYNIIFKPNISGCFKGVQIRADDVHVQGGVIDGVRRYGIIISKPASNAAEVVSLFPSITNTVITSIGEDGLSEGTESKGIISVTDSSVIDINGVRINGCREESILVKSSSTGVGDTIILRTSTIDGGGTDNPYQVAVRLETSGSLVQVSTIRNVRKGVSQAIGASNEISLLKYVNNGVDEVVE